MSQGKDEGHSGAPNHSRAALDGGESQDHSSILVPGQLDKGWWRETWHTKSPFPSTSEISPRFVPEQTCPLTAPVCTCPWRMVKAGKYFAGCFSTSQEVATCWPSCFLASDVHSVTGQESRLNLNIEEHLMQKQGAALRTLFSPCMGTQTHLALCWVELDLPVHMHQCFWSVFSACCHGLFLYLLFKNSHFFQFWKWIQRAQVNLNPKMVWKEEVLVCFLIPNSYLLGAFS